MVIIMLLVEILNLLTNLKTMPCEIVGYILNKKMSSTVKKRRGVVLRACMVDLFLDTLGVWLAWR